MGLGIGSEVLCIMTGGLDMSGHEETDPVKVAAERIARAWMCERGSIWWAPERGLGLGLLQNGDLSPGQLRRIAIDARNEAMREDGVIAADVKASLVGGLLTLVGKFEIDSGQEFTLTVDASGASVLDV